MSDYSTLQVSLLYSENADYTSPQYVLNLAAYEDTPTEFTRQRVSAATGGSVVELGSYSTVRTIIVKNLDNTNYVTATWNNLAASAQSQRIGAGTLAGQGKILVITDVSPAADLTLTANTAAVICDVSIIGD